MEGYKSKAELRCKLINTLLNTWEEFPELRLGQLISCVKKDNDLFALYDEKFVKLLEDFQDEHSANPR